MFFCMAGRRGSALQIGAAPLDRDQDGSSLKGMFFMNSKHGEKIFGRGIDKFQKTCMLVLST